MISKINIFEIIYSYKIHYIYEDGIIILLLSEQVDDKIAFAYLNDLKRDILKSYSIEDLKNTEGLQLEEAKNILFNKMLFYNAHPVTTSAGEMLTSLNLAKDAIIENVENLLERDNKINLVVQKSDNLKDHSNNISAILSELSKRKNESKNIYVIMIILLFIFILILIYLISF